MEREWLYRFLSNNNKIEMWRLEQETGTLVILAKNERPMTTFRSLLNTIGLTLLRRAYL